MKKYTEKILENKPDYLFHLAAQSIVLKSYENPRKTWNTNLIGTMNVLESLRALNKKCTAIIITSDKCYKNIETKRGYKETDTLGGLDPYSASKASAEILINSYVNSYFSNGKILLCSARAGNVIGGGDWSSYRVVPDCVKSTYKNKKTLIRNPNSTRPWQHVLEPLSGYITLALRLNSNTKLHGGSYNFGRIDQKNYKVIDLIKKMNENWEEIKWKIEKNKKRKYESSLLNLNCQKAKNKLGWINTLNFEQTVKLTVDWYKNYYENKGDTQQITSDQIDKYTILAKQKHLFWSV